MVNSTYGVIMEHKIIKYTLYNQNKPIKCVDFKSLVDQYNFIIEHINLNTFNIKDEIKKDSGWNGKHSLDESLKAMFFGFDNNTNYFLNNVNIIRSQDGIGEGYYMDSEGLVYDMGAFVSGEPECCLNMGLPEVKPSFKIMVDISFSSQYTEKQINNRGIAITNLINTLLINGYLVDLYFMLYNTQYDMDVMFTIDLDTKCLPIATIAYLCSTDYFRKICFAVIDKIREKKSCENRGISRLTSFMLDKFKKDDIFFIGGSFNNPEIGDKINTIDSANKYILELFNKFCKEHKIKISLEDI